MKHFNLLNNFRWFATIILLITLGIGQMWGTDYFSDNFSTATGSSSISSRTGWSNFTQVYAHYGCAIRLGSKNNAGSIKKAAMTEIGASSTTIVLHFAAKSYGTDNSELNISVSNAGTANTTNFILRPESSTSASFSFEEEDYFEVIITGATSSTTITFSTTAANKRVFLGDISICSYESSGKYVRIENSGNIAEGDYLIVYNNSNALNTKYGSWNTNTYGTYTSVSSYYTSSTKSIAANATTDGLAYHVKATTNGYYIRKKSSGGFLGNSSNSTGSSLRWDRELTASRNEWTLGVNSIVSVRNSSYAIRFDNTSNPNRFAIYGPSGQQQVQLFKKVAASCSENPSVGSVSLNGSFNLNSIPLQASVSSDGGTGCSITEAGFVWTSDGTDPTISNNKTTGTYSTNITGTIPSAGSFSTGVTYKIKAYATNGHGDGLSSSSFTLIPRSVTFNLNGHGSSTPSVQYVNNGGLATDPSYSESVTGYTFGGWYKEAGCSNSWTFGSDAVSGENKTLYAKWTAKNYTITLNQDLTPTSAGTTSIAVTYNSNDNLTSAITPPTKTGWTFAGYYTEKNGNGTQIIDADGNVNAGVATYTDASKNWIKASGVTLYAKWTCTVTWSVNNLTNVYSAQTLTYNGTSTKVASVPGPPSPATYCGDKFVGWTTEENVAQDDDDGLGLFTNVAGSPELKTVGNTTFYAVFADYDE